MKILTENMGFINVRFYKLGCLIVKLHWFSSTHSVIHKWRKQSSTYVHQLKLSYTVSARNSGKMYVYNMVLPPESFCFLIKSHPTFMLFFLRWESTVVWLRNAKIWRTGNKLYFFEVHENKLIIFYSLFEISENICRLISACLMNNC